jgi:hypothetical protein
MGKISIYISLVDGKLVYRDTEQHHGKTIETEANPGDGIIWTLDKDSGITDLTGINITGPFGFFSKGPSKKAFDKWTAKIAKKATDEVSYAIFYASGKVEGKTAKTKLKSAATAEQLKDEDPPVIKIKG